jgi:hypothetical protein
MINYKILENLVYKIPSAKMLLNSSGYHHRLVISNRNQVYSIHARFRKELFFEFCRTNRIPISNALKSIINKYQLLLVDIDSLLTDTYRIYFSKENFLYDIEYQEFNKFPIEHIDIEKCYDLAKDYIDYYQTTNALEFQKRVELADTKYPIVLSRDDLGNHSIIDGVHRVYKLHQLAQSTVPARMLHLRDRLNLMDNIVPNSELKFNDSAVDAAFSKIKSNFSNQESLVLKHFYGLGIYYSTSKDHTSLYKFYFQSAKDSASQYKIDQKHQFIGKFDEFFIDSGDFFEDNINIKELFVDRIKSSHRRPDVDQSYLVVDIKE